MSDLNEINYQIRATQNAVFDLETELYSDGHNLNDVDNNYFGAVPNTVGYVDNISDAKEHLFNLERYFRYLNSVRKEVE